MNNIQQINHMFKYLTSHSENSPEFETFIALLRGLKDFSTIVDFYGSEFVDLLLKKVLPALKGNRNKALVIETIVEATYGEIDILIIEELFKQYILLLEDYATTLENASRCLGGMIASGIQQQEIFNTIVKFKDKDYAISLLAFSNILSLEIVDDATIFLRSQVVDAHRIKQRTYFFTQFVVILHPLIGQYKNVSAIDFVFDYEGARIDWPFSQTGSSQRLISANILTEREGLVFEELGKLLHDETVELSSPRIKNMYQTMFDGKDPLDVIFTLPVSYHS